MVFGERAFLNVLSSVVLTEDVALLEAKRSHDGRRAWNQERARSRTVFTRETSGPQRVCMAARSGHRTVAERPEVCDPLARPW